MEQFEHIDASEFAFVQMDARLHDAKLEKKSRGYFADAMIRFRKNKSSVVAAWILLFLLLFAIFAPELSIYTVEDTDERYQNFPPFLPIAVENNWGFWDGSDTMDGRNETQYVKMLAIGKETGMNPFVKELGSSSTWEKIRGKWVEKFTYKVEYNKYYSLGLEYYTLTYSEFEDLVKWQDENDIQVIYPYVYFSQEQKEIKNADIWYKVDDKGKPIYDTKETLHPSELVNHLQPIYCTDESGEYKKYDGKRIEGDDGSYIYSYMKSRPTYNEDGSIKSDGTVEVRLCYYNYYTYLNGHEPFFIFGTTGDNMDMFTAIGMGARFSLIFAILVSAINLTIGAIVGAIQGYYGGWIDMIIDRTTDILARLPFMVCVTLFQLHFAKTVGVVGAFLFAYVLTGWIGMAALTRKQFYRFKGQEYVMAARTLGASDKRLMFKHIFPNAIGTIITSCVLVIPGVISTETTFAYLNIIDLSDFAGTSIGKLMSMGQNTAANYPHTMLFPALFVALLLICFNLFGNGLRDAFNPSNRGVED